MEQINHKVSEEIENENSLKLLGKKTIHFTVKKYPRSVKKSSIIKYPDEYLNKGRWSYTEQIKFIKALSKVGPDWKKISEEVIFRTLPQIRSHAQKFFRRLKRCKNNELGIDFTSNSIRSFKDMINHIKLVNNNYDINNIFLYLSYINQKFLDELTKKSKDDELPHLMSAIVGSTIEELTNRKNDFLNTNKMNISNKNFQIDDKYNNKFDSNNLNTIRLLDSLNNMNNNLNVLILNYLNKSRITNNLINQLYNVYFEYIDKALSNISQLSSANTPNYSNNSNINENKNNINTL